MTDMGLRKDGGLFSSGSSAVFSEEPARGCIGYDAVMNVAHPGAEIDDGSHVRAVKSPPASGVALNRSDQVEFGPEMTPRPWTGCGRRENEMPVSV